MGLTKEQIHQPFVGVASCWNEAAPCNIALGRQAPAGIALLELDVARILGGGEEAPDRAAGGHRWRRPGWDSPAR